jgi:predicted metal-dependent peptidase
MKPAVNKFVMKHTFFAQLFFAKDNVEDNNMPTAYTSLKKRGFNKEFMLQHPLEEQIFIICHEVMHDILDHQSRVGSRERMIFNMAADYELNRILASEGVSVPQSALLDLKYDAGWSAEKIYEDLIQNAKKVEISIKANGIGQDIEFDVEDGEGELSEEEKKALKEQFKNAISEAYQLTKQFGKLSAALQRHVEDILYPKQKWYEVLRNYFMSFDWADYDWTKINHREYSKSGLLAPRLYSEELDHVLIAVDCSGSIGNTQLAEFQGHINNILDECHPKKTSVVYFDSKVCHVDEYDKYSYPIVLKPHGGGGTDFRWLEEYNDKGIDVCVFLTDGYGHWPENGSVMFPVIWCINHQEDMNVPFGEMLRLEN